MKPVETSVIKSIDSIYIRTQDIRYNLVSRDVRSIALENTWNKLESSVDDSVWGAVYSSLRSVINT